MTANDHPAPAPEAGFDRATLVHVQAGYLQDLRSEAQRWRRKLREAEAQILEQRADRPPADGLKTAS